MLLQLAIGAAVAGATYATQRRKRADTKAAATTAVIAGAATATTAAVLMSLLPPLVLLALPAAGYWAWKRSRSRRALPPGP